jgi:hypothetical protein
VPAAAAPLPPGPVNQCGTLQAYAAVDPARNGSASAQFTIDGTTYLISAAPPGGPAFRQTIDPAAKTVGTRVCLTGTIIEAHTAENVLGDLTLQPASATASPGRLPSTSTAPDNWGVLAALGLIAIALYTFMLLNRRNRKRI